MNHITAQGLSDTQIAKYIFLLKHKYNNKKIYRVNSIYILKVLTGLK